MKIEDIKQFLIKRIDYQHTQCSSYENDYKEVLEGINKLEADKLELSKAIVENEYQDINGWNYCLFCNEGSLKGYKHLDNCIVNKATKYLGERSERD